MSLSLQRLGDNPRDFDATFSGFTPETAEVRSTLTSRVLLCEVPQYLADVNVSVSLAL